MKSVVHVNILGQQYAIRSTVEPEAVEKAAAFVNGKISEVSSGSRTVDSHQAIVLAFLNVAGEYLQEQEANRKCGEKLKKLLERLEQVA
ncbi:MAG: cell division protein ZapA [Deltaproteobacteria bacterium]|nr:cell division protein ZapA [Deltaproteobacteria bacterium]